MHIHLSRLDLAVGVGASIVALVTLLATRGKQPWQARVVRGIVTFCAGGVWAYLLVARPQLPRLREALKTGE